MTMKHSRIVFMLCLFLLPGFAWSQANAGKVLKDIDVVLEALIKAGNPEVLKMRDAFKANDLTAVKPIPLSGKKLDAKTMNALYSAAYDLIEAGQFEQALAQLAAAGPENDPAGSLFNYMALAYFRMAEKSAAAGQFTDALKNCRQAYVYVLSARTAGKNVDQLFRASVLNLMYYAERSKQPLVAVGVGKSVKSSDINVPSLINSYIALVNASAGDTFVFVFLNSLRDILTQKIQSDMSGVLASHWVIRQLALKDKRTIPFLSAYFELTAFSNPPKELLINQADFWILAGNWKAAVKAIESYMKQYPQDPDRQTMAEILDILKDHNYTLTYTASFSTSALDDKTVEIGIHLPVPLLSTEVGSIEVFINGKSYRKFRDLKELAAVKEGEMRSVSKDPAGLFFILSLKAGLFSIGNNQVRVRIAVKKTRAPMSVEAVLKWRLADYKPEQALIKLGRADNKIYQLAHPGIQKPLARIRQLGPQASLEEIIRIAYDETISFLEYDNAAIEALKKNGALPHLTLDRASGGRGVCLDYALRMAVILRAAGVPAWVVTGQVTTNPLGHAWVLIALPDGGFVLSDPTYGDTGWKKYGICQLFDANDRIPVNIITDNDPVPVLMFSNSKTLFQNPSYSVTMEDASGSAGK